MYIFLLLFSISFRSHLSATSESDTTMGERMDQHMTQQCRSLTAHQQLEDMLRPSGIGDKTADESHPKPYGPGQMNSSEEVQYETRGNGAPIDGGRSPIPARRRFG